ncbi:hypothetical protein ACIA5D_44625 [Actinoplanes sp. NPDC051513]|uniref:hypothetical protein n=1 Tax=Actinoplanes sp. NPDC051513 TaxID=3363908 RepID=UPI0037BBE90B
MIVASLLLILVAVTLLVLGLTGGSSNLLISSIVASLLAAVALVIGARQSGAARRAAREPAAGPTAPEYAAEPAPAERITDDFAPAGATFAAESAQSDLSDKRETVQLEPVAYDDVDLEEPEPAPEREPGHAEAYDEVYDEAFEAGRRDAAAGMTGASGARRDPDLADPDRDLAAEAINAARSENPDEHAWRRPEAAAHAESSAVAEHDAAFDLDDADDDDPADEPLPQKVSPADAARVARLDAEVLVVDGRPRYHLPECPHLIGRLTEPIPVNEAVELGFSPCGLCRPVDHLVAAAARH